MDNRAEIASVPEDIQRLVKTTTNAINLRVDMLKSNYKPGPWVEEVPQFEIPILDEKYENHNPYFTIGCRIDGEGNEIVKQTATLCIVFSSTLTDSGSADKKDFPKSCCAQSHPTERRVVRRFHFDYQPRDKIFPKYHMQYGGKLGGLNRLGPVHYCIEDFMEEPRIPYYPMDFVLLMDMSIREFVTEFKKWPADGNWMKIVKKSDLIWRTNYVADIHDLLQRSGLATIHQHIYEYPHDY